jgi:hypothetical protein
MRATVRMSNEGGSADGGTVLWCDLPAQATWNFCADFDRGAVNPPSTPWTWSLQDITQGAAIATNTQNVSQPLSALFSTPAQANGKPFDTHALLVKSFTGSQLAKHLEVDFTLLLGQDTGTDNNFSFYFTTTAFFGKNALGSVGMIRVNGNWYLTNVLGGTSSTSSPIAVTKPSVFHRFLFDLTYTTQPSPNALTLTVDGVQVVPFGSTATLGSPDAITQVDVAIGLWSGTQSSPQTTASFDNVRMRLF